MKRWNQWTRKHDDVVERRSRLEKTVAERTPEDAGQEGPAVADETVPETHVTVSKRGESEHSPFERLFRRPPDRKGRNVVIDNKFGSQVVTKDGVTVAKEIYL